MTLRLRADRLLVARGVFASRAQAQAAIAAGLVTADRIKVRKPSEPIAIGAQLTAEPAHQWVSRGGLKLAAALQHFRYDPCGRVCIDVGASTGGFTDVLLSRGARLVYAVDVGHDQLHGRLRTRPEVIAMQGTDIRGLNFRELVPAPDVIVVDVSFISLTLVLPTPLAFMHGQLIALVKPQFEAGRQHLKKGIVRAEAVQAMVCQRIAGWVAARGWTVDGVIASPVPGRDGNREFLLGARRD